MKEYKQDIYAFDVNKLGEFKEALLQFLDMLSKGKKDEAHQILCGCIMTQPFFLTENISETKLSIQIINSYCVMKLLNEQIQMEASIEIYKHLRKKIECIQSKREVPLIIDEMCSQYSLLSKMNFYPQYPKSVNAVINYIHANYEQPINLSTIAKYYNKNATSLSATFKKYTGTTVSNYIQQVRIKKAMELFDLTAMSVSDVAVAVGFQDFAYFSKVFKKQAGCSPKEYREKHK